MPREYPRIMETGLRTRWKKDPKTAPRCIAPGCECLATHQPVVQVNWFRGEDEQGGPVCMAHSADPKLLLEWTEVWQAENRRKEQEARRRKAERAAGLRATAATPPHRCSFCEGPTTEGKDHAWCYD